MISTAKACFFFFKARYCMSLFKEDSTLMKQMLS